MILILRFRLYEGVGSSVWGCDKECLRGMHPPQNLLEYWRVAVSCVNKKKLSCEWRMNRFWRNELAIAVYNRDEATLITIIERISAQPRDAGHKAVVQYLDSLRTGEDDAPFFWMAWALATNNKDDILADYFIANHLENERKRLVG